MLNVRSYVICGFIAAAMVTRLLPHPPNFTAVGAICLFGGAFFRPRWAAFLIPFAAVFLSDILLSLYVFGYWTATPFKHVLFALTVLIGMWIGVRPSPKRIFTGAVGASLMFFVLSNLAVWHGSTRYPQTMAGLAECYVAAIPFASNMLIGNLFFSWLLFGGFKSLENVWQNRKWEKGISTAK